ncbi:MAG: hypothetical protein OSA98_26230, partial [Rubripirellula sp.]|nr:hypothetical protein [Rubripirellula sp.]
QQRSSTAILNSDPQQRSSTAHRPEQAVSGGLSVLIHAGPLRGVPIATMASVMPAVGPCVLSRPDDPTGCMVLGGVLN